MVKVKTAMIFGAGLGTRMRPLTNDMPKPLLNVCGKPIISYIIDKLVDAGIEKIVVNTHYKAEKLEQYLSNYPDINITCIYEEELLNTGGGVLQALPELGKSPFYIINGDVIWLDGATGALHRLAEHWGDNKKALLLLQPTNLATGYDGLGDFDISSTGQLKISNDSNKPYVFTGIQLFDPTLLKGLTIHPFSIVDIYRNLIQTDGTIEDIYGLVHDNDWLHIGTPEGLALAEQALSSQTELKEAIGD